MHKIVQMADSQPFGMGFGQELAYAILKKSDIDDPIIRMAISAYENKLDNNDEVRHINKLLTDKFNGQAKIESSLRLAAAIVNPLEEVDGHALEYFIYWAGELGIGIEEFSVIFANTAAKLDNGS
jgi:hypothetical protein